MKRITYIVIFCLFFLLVIGAFILAKRRTAAPPVSQAPKEEPTPSLPPVGEGGLPGYDFTPPTTDKFSIETKEGTVDIKNIYTEPGESLSSGGRAFKNTEQYYIAYYPQDQGFIISILDPHLDSARMAAEQEFLDTLGITKEAACKLKVSLGVPFSVNAQAAGGEYGLSFCPNGKSFPKTK